MTDIQVADVIAQLDVFERDLSAMVVKVREFRHILFDTLDNDPDELVD